MEGEEKRRGEGEREERAVVEAARGWFSSAGALGARWMVEG